MNQPLTCDRCGEPIGAYEELWWRRPDGSIIDASFTNVQKEGWRDDPASKFYHRACLRPTPMT
jgi:hypothetical protein